MTEVLKINEGAEEAVRHLLAFLLETKKVKGVFTLSRMNKDGAIGYSLITKPDVLKEALPLFPLMPVNAAGLLSRLTQVEPLTQPVAAVVKPCELRAFIELVKRNQGSLENLLLISSTCAGVYPLEFTINGDLIEKLPQYWDAVKKGEIAPDIRPTCAGCIHCVPQNADVTVGLIGKDDLERRCELFINTDEGKRLVDGFKGEFTEEEIESEEVKRFLSKRETKRRSLFDEVKTEQFGMEGLIDTFGRCISCRGCSKVCPICYCDLCFFDSKTSEYEPSSYDMELEKRGGLRVPPDVVFYQLGRMTHVSISCVGCGSCTDVCPADIPVSSIFLKIGEYVQNLFNYVPGKDKEEEIPLLTFETEEFVEVEE